MDDLHRSGTNPLQQDGLVPGELGADRRSPLGSPGEWQPVQQTPGLDGSSQRNEEAVKLQELLRQVDPSGALAADALILSHGSGWQQDLLQQGADREEERMSSHRDGVLVHSLLVIDQSQPNWRELVVSAPGDTEVLVLDPDRAGISQVGDYHGSTIRFYRLPNPVFDWCPNFL